SRISRGLFGENIFERLLENPEIEKLIAPWIQRRFSLAAVERLDGRSLFRRRRRFNFQLIRDTKDAGHVSCDGGDQSKVVHGWHDAIEPCDAVANIDTHRLPAG